MVTDGEGVDVGVPLDVGPATTFAVVVPGERHGEAAAASPSTAAAATARTPGWRHQGRCSVRDTVPDAREAVV